MKLLTQYVMAQKSIPNIVIDHAAGLCLTNTANTADCAPPIQFIHAVSDSCAGYFFIVNVYKVYMLLK